MTEHSRTPLITSFCPDRPFGFSVHRDTHFCPSRLFRFSTCRVYRFFHFHPLFLPESFWFAGKPLFLPRCVNLAGIWLCVVFFPTMSTLSECRELSLSVALCCYTTRRCSILQDSLLKFLPNASSDSDGDLPLAVWLLRDSLNLDLTAPDDRQWSRLPLDWKCFCSLDIRRANFYTVQTNSHMQAMLY